MNLFFSSMYEALNVAPANLMGSMECLPLPLPFASVFLSLIFLF